MCLTQPLILDIQENQGKSLFYDVPQEFLIEHIEIIVFSFEPSIENFKDYVKLMQNYYIKHSRLLKSFHFNDALTFICNILKKKDQRWLCNLKKVGKYFSTLIVDVILKKETKLTDEILQAALSQDDDFLLNIKDTKLAKETHQITEHFWKDAYDQNQEYPKFQEFIEDFEYGKLSKDVLQLMQYANIDCLLPTQELCLRYTL